jgi:hypothetical protein
MAEQDSYRGGVELGVPDERLARRASACRLAVSLLLTASFLDTAGV